MAKVFLSHASGDIALTHEVHQWLEKAGHEVFQHQHPRDGIPIGEDWEELLYQRLRWANALVCLITPAYLASMWCTAEIGAARSQGTRLLPLCPDSRVIHPLLPSIQHIDLEPERAVARATLIEALRRVDTVWPKDRSPFPGLRPFDSDLHRVFFGRAKETAQLAGLLRSPAERAVGAALLVVGPSGCGKSSLVRAGLLPVMAAEPGWWTLPPILPGTDPLAALARELATAARQAGLDWTVAHVRDQLDHGGGLNGLAEELLVAAPDGPRRHLLLVVDQFEELLTQTSPAQRVRFAELLRLAPAGPVHLVVTLRPEFLDQLLLDPALAALPTHTYALRPLGREALRTVIDKPAELAGIDLEDGLAARLVDDTDSGEALPLLAFTLAQLAQGLTRGGRLSTVGYDQLGGVQGALTRQADAALTEAITAGGRSGEEVIGGLLRLVTVDEQGRPTRWRVNRAELPDHVVTELDAFITRRLLTTDTDNGTAVLGVAHEAFLTAWPPLADAIAKNVSALRARRAIEHAATEWHDHHRPPTRLWGGGQLAASVTDTGAQLRARSESPSQPRYQRWLPQRHRALSTDRVDLSPKARDFLHASIRRDRFRRRRIISVLSVLLILALMGAGVAVFLQREAQQQQRIAIARQLIAQAEATLVNDPGTALRLGIAAHHIQPDGEAHASLVNTLVTTHYAGKLTGHTGTVQSMVFSPDGHILATGSADNTVILWDLTNPAQPHQTLTGHTSPVRSVAFSPDGHTLATASYNRMVILWDLTDPARPRQLGPPLTGHADSAYAMAFSPDGHILATSSEDNTVILWDLTNPAQPHQTLTGHTSPVVSVAFSPDGHTFATGSEDNTAILWDLTDPARPRQLGPPLTGHTGPVVSVAFAPDGHTLATGSEDNTAILWDLTNPARPRQLGPPLTGHTGPVYSVAFAPDGRTLATGSTDSTVILWDLTNPARPRQLDRPLTGHTGPVISVAFAPDGRTLATGSTDSTAILWDLTNPARPRQTLTGHTYPVVSVAFAPDGRTLATGSTDSTVILWDLTAPARPRQLGPPLTGHTGPVYSVAFAPDGHTLATGSEDNTAILWDLTGLNDLRDHAREHACAITNGGLDRDEWSRYIRGLPYQDTCTA